MASSCPRFAIFWLLFLLVPIAKAQQKAEKGLLDARIFDFSNHRLSLDGEWGWVDDELLDPQQLADRQLAWVPFPRTWNDTRVNRNGQGVATYRLRVLLPPDQRNFAIELPQIYSSYRIWVNDRPLGANGVPATSAEACQPQWLPQTLYFEARDSVQIVLQIANFHHHLGGCKEPLYLGGASTMAMKHTIAKGSKIIESGALAVMAVAFVVIYLLYGRKKIVIYFSLLCLTWAIRSVFSNDYLFITFFPDFDWATMVRIEYITLYLTMIWAILFLSRLFANEGSQIIKYILVTVNSVYVAFTLFNQPIYFTKMLAAYLVTSGILLLYGGVIVVRALINERTGSTFLILSTLLAIFVFAYDIVTYEGFFSYNSILFSTGYLIIFMLMAIALLLNLGIIKSAPKSSNMLTYNDLYGDQHKQ
jgi:hypothetical protein